MPAPPEESRPSRLVTAWTVLKDVLDPTTLVVLVTALVLLLVGLFGGWRSATAAASTEVRTVRAGQTVQAGPWRIAARKAHALPSLGTLVPARPGQRLIALSMTVTNTSKLPVHAALLKQTLTPTLKDQLDWSGKVSKVPRVDVYRAVDDTAAATIGPSMPATYVIVWFQSTSQPAPSTLEVDVTGWTYRRSSLDGSRQWLDPTVTAHLSVPVEEAR